MVQLRIRSALRQQLLMCALLLNSIRGQHQDAACIADGGEAVRDDKGGSSFCQLDRKSVV